ncbi:MAG: hypothetical protein WCO60_05080 [Verrucomicrobiota bacterium]
MLFSKKTIHNAGYAALLGFVAYQWIESDTMQIRLNQSFDTLRTAQRETEEVKAQLAESKQQLETAQSRLQEVNAQLSRTRSVGSSVSSDGASAASGANSVASSTSFTESLIQLAEKAARLDRGFKAFPALEIPELSLLTEADWIKVVSDHANLETPEQMRRALESLVASAKGRALEVFRDAAFRTGVGSDTKSTANLDPLLSELRQKLNGQILQRYELLPAASLESGWFEQPDVKRHVSSVDQAPALIVREKAPAGGQQQVLVFFAMPQSRDNGKRYTSSSIFALLQKSRP